MNTHEIEALFKKFCEGTEQDKAEVAEYIRKSENFAMMRSAEFVQVAVSWAERLGIKKLTDEEAEAYDLELVVEICPCCGQEMEN
jgi:hypothetical protein